MSRILSNARAAPVGSALALLPVADRLVRDVDAPRELHLRQPQTPAHPTSEPRHVTNRFGVVIVRLPRDVLLGRRLQHGMIDPSRRKALRVVRVNPRA